MCDGKMSGMYGGNVWENMSPIYNFKYVTISFTKSLIHDSVINSITSNVNFLFTNIQWQYRNK